MSGKKKFKPKITRVKLNPEQAVLSCSCYDGGRLAGGGIPESMGLVCDGGKSFDLTDEWMGTVSSS